MGFDSDPGAAVVFDTDNATSLNIRAEIEGELFLRDNFSVSASRGIEFVSAQAANTAPGSPGPDSQSSFRDDRTPAHRDRVPPVFHPGPISNVLTNSATGRVVLGVWSLRALFTADLVQRRLVSARTDHRAGVRGVE